MSINAFSKVRPAVAKIADSSGAPNTSSYWRAYICVVSSCAGIAEAQRKTSRQRKTVAVFIAASMHGCCYGRALLAAGSVNNVSEGA